MMLRETGSANHELPQRIKHIALQNNLIYINFDKPACRKQARYAQRAASVRCKAERSMHPIS